MIEYIYRANADTDYSFGCRPEERGIEEYINTGIINVDKPSGPTSSEVDKWLKDILRADRVGHGGTLDPKVTGVLPLAVNRATKALPLLLLSPKEYVCLMHIHKPTSEEDIVSVLDEFTGKIYQRPPVKSAVSRNLRIRSVYKLNLLEIEDNQDVLFRITCQSGTYIRKYCHDIGEVLGCGAHMAELRRTMAGPFTEHDTLTTLQDVLDARIFYEEDGNEDVLRSLIHPMEFAVRNVKKIYIKDSAVSAIAHGANLASSGVVKIDSRINVNNTVAIMTLKDELVATGKALYSAEEISSDETRFVVDIQKVFILPNTYPKMWK